MKDEKSHYHWKTESTLILTVSIVPGAQKTAFGEIKDGALRIFIKAQPKDNEANEALIRFISREFKTPQFNIAIVSGSKSKHKILSIDNPRTIPQCCLPSHK